MIEHWAARINLSEAAKLRIPCGQRRSARSTTKKTSFLDVSAAFFQITHCKYNGDFSSEQTKMDFTHKIKYPVIKKNTIPVSPENCG
jgi:hypothetical protein